MSGSFLSIEQLRPSSGGVCFEHRVTQVSHWMNRISEQVSQWVSLVQIGPAPYTKLLFPNHGTLHKHTFFPVIKGSHNEQETRKYVHKTRRLRMAAGCDPVKSL